MTGPTAGAVVQIHPTLNCNLACANLRNARMMRAKVEGADLRGADLTGANLVGVDLTKALTKSPEAEKPAQPEASEEAAVIPESAPEPDVNL